jgi:FkbM family methyltransferase
MKTFKTPEDFVFNTFEERKNFKLEDWGKYEFEKIVFPNLNNRRKCLDIGAHIGLTSYRYSKFFQEVYSFEPIHYDLLKENLEDCQNVKIFPNAISDECGTVSMYKNPHNSGSNIVVGSGTEKLLLNRYKKTKARFESEKSFDVESITIDSLNLTEIDFIKIDVEGYNIPVIEGMIELLERENPVIQIETSQNRLVNEKVLKKLLTLGYKKFDEYGTPIDQFYKR